MITRQKHVTLGEVAKKAGVGTTTVSRAINGGQNVDPKTLARVQRVIESLGYMPNQAARILKGDRTRTVGLIVPSIADPFFSACAEAAQSVARANDSALIVLATQNDPKREQDAVNLLLRHRVDGIMIAPAHSESDALRQLLGKIPIASVAIDRPVAGSLIPSVLADNFSAALGATRHLLDHGYDYIACLTGEANLYTIEERIRGYRAAMASAGFKAVVITCIDDYMSAEIAIKRLLATAKPPRAFFSLKNSTTIFAFEALQRLNVPVPASIALLGFDDFELADTVRPSISVVQQPVNEIGRAAAELLFRQLLERGDHSNGGGDESRWHVELKTRLVRRTSCGCSSTPP